MHCTPFGQAACGEGGVAGQFGSAVPRSLQVQVVGWPLQAVGAQKQQVVPYEQPIAEPDPDPEPEPELAPPPELPPAPEPVPAREPPPPRDPVAVPSRVPASPVAAPVFAPQPAARTVDTTTLQPVAMCSRSFKCRPPFSID